MTPKLSSVLVILYYFYHHSLAVNLYSMKLDDCKTKFFGFRLRNSILFYKEAINMVLDKIKQTHDVLRSSWKYDCLRIQFHPHVIRQHLEVPRERFDFRKIQVHDELALEEFQYRWKTGWYYANFLGKSEVFR